MQQKILKTSSKIPGSEIDNILAIINKWEKIRLITISDDLVLEIDGIFPEGKYGHGYFNFGAKGNPISGHLKEGSVDFIQLFQKHMHGKETYSVEFFNAEEKSIFKAFLGRDEEGNILASPLKAFEELMAKYS